MADEPGFVYQGEVAGVVCNACSSHVKAALLKIEGVEEVTIRKSSGGGLPQLMITATHDRITRAAAIAALGEKAGQYDIRSLDLMKDASPKSTR